MHAPWNPGTGNPGQLAGHVAAGAPRLTGDQSRRLDDPRRPHG
ncbi:hypothetical protein [Streptomyces sp. H51]|nr:hypothetical protein [Streptomyces sp. H51]